MTISMYRISVPVFVERLRALSLVLSRGEANAIERKLDPETLLGAKLAPDMFPLKRQVQIATDHAKGASCRLAGRKIPKLEDDEASFAQLQARIAKTRDLLATFAPADIDGSEERRIEIRTSQRELSFTGSDYLLDFAMPNFYFHITTAYAILRHNGVELGKRDFLIS